MLLIKYQEDSNTKKKVKMHIEQLNAFQKIPDLMKLWKATKKHTVEP